MTKNFYRETEKGIEVLLDGKYNQVAIIDKADLPLIRDIRWYAHRTKELRRGNFYASSRKDNTTVYMHRIISNTPKGKVTDHINGDTLDNRRSNLRVVTMVENANNNGGLARRSSKTGILGVSKHKNNTGRMYWAASHNQGKKHLYEYFPFTDEGLRRAELRAIEMRSNA